MPARPAKYAALRLKELEEQRRRVVAAMRDLVENSEREGRSDLTAEEAAAFNAMDAAQEKLRKQIEQYKDYEDLLRQHKDFSHEQLLAMYAYLELMRRRGYIDRLDGSREYIAPPPWVHIAAEQQRRANRPRKSRRNPKVTAWVLQHRAGRTASELSGQLERMSKKDLRRAIGQPNAPSVSTLQRIIASAKRLVT